jgi:hypothetical protein
MVNATFQKRPAFRNVSGMQPRSWASNGRRIDDLLGKAAAPKKDRR